MEAQNWACVICQRIPKTKLDVDHNHVSGEFRGMLCKRCNTALGKFQDSPEMLLRAAAYLKGEL